MSFISYAGTTAVQITLDSNSNFNLSSAITGTQKFLVVGGATIDGSSVSAWSGKARADTNAYVGNATAGQNGNLALLYQYPMVQIKFESTILFSNSSSINYEDLTGHTASPATSHYITIFVYE